MESNQIRKALLIVDLQEDFISPNGPFKHTHVRADHIVSNLRETLPRFREENGLVIWIKSDYSNSQLEAKYLRRPEGKQFEGVPLNDTFLSGTHQTFPLCIPGQHGENFIDEVHSILIHERDRIVTKTYYSAFTDTTLNILLKDTLEVHICGLMTNCCVQATAADAFFYGHKVFIWTDCLGYRNKKKHNLVLIHMAKWYATLTTSKQSSLKSESR